MKALLTYTQTAEVLNTTYTYVKNKAVPSGTYPVCEMMGKVYVDWTALSERVKSRADHALAERYIAENARELARLARQGAEASRLSDLAESAFENLRIEAMRKYRKAEIHTFYSIRCKVAQAIADDCQTVAAWMLLLANDIRTNLHARERGFIDMGDCFEQVAKHLRNEGYHNIVLSGDGRRFRAKVAAFKLPATMDERNGVELVTAIGEERLRSLLSGKLGNQCAAKPDWHRSLVHRLYIANRAGEGARLDAVEVQARYGYALADLLQSALEEHGDAVRIADYEPADARTVRNWIKEASVLAAAATHGKATATAKYRPHHHRAKPDVNALWSGDGWAAPTTGSTSRKTWIWYDANTGYAVGWCNSADGEGESTRVVLAALRHAFETTGILPKAIQIDYSMMERDALKDVFGRLGIQVVAKEAGKPNSSYAERHNLELGKAWKRADANWIATSAASANTRRRREDIGHSIPKMDNEAWSAAVSNILRIYNGTPRPVLGLHPDRKASKINAERYYCPKEAWVRGTLTHPYPSKEGNEMPTSSGMAEEQYAWRAYYLGEKSEATVTRGDIWLRREGVAVAYRLDNYWEHIPARQDTLRVDVAYLDEERVFVFHAATKAYIGIAPRVEQWQEGDKAAIATQSAQAARYDKAAKNLTQSAGEIEIGDAPNVLRKQRLERGNAPTATPKPQPTTEDDMPVSNKKYDLLAAQRARIAAAKNQTNEPLIDEDDDY